MFDDTEKLLRGCLPGGIYCSAVCAVLAWNSTDTHFRAIAILVAISLAFSGPVCFDYGSWRARQRRRGKPHSFADYYSWPLAQDRQTPPFPPQT